MEQYGLGEKEIDVVLSNKKMADYFEAAHAVFNNTQRILGWLLGPVLELVNACPQSWDGVKMKAENFAKVVQYFSEGTLNNVGAKKVLRAIFATDEDVDSVIARDGLMQVSTVDELESVIAQVVASNGKTIEQIRGGNDKAIMSLIGQVMKKTGGKANPKVARELLEKCINM